MKRSSALRTLLALLWIPLGIVSCRTPIPAPTDPCQRAGFWLTGTMTATEGYGAALHVTFGEGLVEEEAQARLLVLERLKELEARCYARRQR